MLVSLVTTVQMTREYLSISDPTCCAVAGELPVSRSPSSQQAAQAASGRDCQAVGSGFRNYISWKIRSKVAMAI